jgi:hypothetical protein
VLVMAFSPDTQLAFVTAAAVPLDPVKRCTLMEKGRRPPPAHSAA